ncbi:MAG: LysR family transcriptional regulator, partial [Sphingomonadales bacterium]|nr:LysR family transcriptional regulator [Sphingomonadales bacterium]
MAVNFQHLRTFHAVALEEGFSRAARRLNISQPTLSQQIKSLEARYHAKLFEGRGRPLRLTPLGQELLVLTRRIFAAADEVEGLFGKQPDDQAIRIRLASDSPIYAARLTQLLLHADPRAAVEVQVDNSRDTLGRLLEAKADVAIVSDPPIDPRFAYKLLFVDTLNV